MGSIKYNNIDYNFSIFTYSAAKMRYLYYYLPTYFLLRIRPTSKWDINGWLHLL